MIPPQFLSETDCRDILQRLAHFTRGEGYTTLRIASHWIGNVRWARNRITTSGDVRDNAIGVERNVGGASGRTDVNDTSTATLVAAARRAERVAGLFNPIMNADLIGTLPLEPSSTPHLFSDATSQLNAEQRAEAAHTLVVGARAAGMLSAGYLEVAAVSTAQLDTFGRLRYFAYTQARMSVTVRNPTGTASGWAGLDHYDWSKIDASAIAARALDKCLKSQNPVRVEPGRYTTILEPQAVSDFLSAIFRHMDDEGRRSNEDLLPPGPFFKSRGTPRTPSFSKIGEKIVDGRITISSDPDDPAMGFPPFRLPYEGRTDRFVIPVYRPVTWIDKGVLVNLPYDRYYGRKEMGRETGLANSRALRMSGGDTSIDEMIATTKRGLLVTRFDQIILIDRMSELFRGYTRDGLWLIENGKITHSAKNLAFTESILFALNRVQQLGPPQRVFNPNEDFSFDIPHPAVVPPLKVDDFSFTALADAV